MNCMANDKTTSEYIKKEVNARLKISTQLYYLVTAKSLLDKLGVSLEDVEMVLRDIEYTCDSVNQGYITFEDLQKTVKDEYGLDIRVGKNA